MILLLIHKNVFPGVLYIAGKLKENKKVCGKYAFLGGEGQLLM